MCHHAAADRRRRAIDIRRACAIEDLVAVFGLHAVAMHFCLNPAIIG